jgi:hypothetical protein
MGTLSSRLEESRIGSENDCAGETHSNFKRQTRPLAREDVHPRPIDRPAKQKSGVGPQIGA